jgi:hypothetical protein
MEDLCGKKKGETKSLSWENGRACQIYGGRSNFALRLAIQIHS